MKKVIVLCLALMMVATLAACSGGSGSAAAYKAGTYTGTGAGNNGDLKVDVTVSDSKITEVVVTEHMETEGLSDPAITDIPAAIVEKQSADVDAVTGATVTSKAIMEAVKDALTQAAA